MRTNTSKYEATHGKKPRGYGQWLFEITFTDGNGSYSSEVIDANGTLAEAKKTAVNRLKSICASANTVVEMEVKP